MHCEMAVILAIPKQRHKPIDTQQIDNLFTSYDEQDWR